MLPQKSVKENLMSKEARTFEVILFVLFLKENCKFY